MAASTSPNILTDPRSSSHLAIEPRRVRNLGVNTASTSSPCRERREAA
jgi:hypothetical protein